MVDYESIKNRSWKEDSLRLARMEEAASAELRLFLSNTVASLSVHILETDDDEIREDLAAGLSALSSAYVAARGGK